MLNSYKEYGEQQSSAMDKAKPTFIIFFISLFYAKAWHKQIETVVFELISWEAI